MANIKRYSTGKIGNAYPDHSNRGNPNSKGLDTNGLPGIEAYIEEDPVLASSDNRPLKNLAENDGILSQNITDVASEVDNGIFEEKYEKFDLTIQPQDIQPDPETGDDITINTLRVASGSAIINGQVTRIGNQKLVYFYRDDDAGSILFPSYDETSDTYQIEIYDDDYFSNTATREFGKYSPVYNTLTDDLPTSFEDYEVVIINRDAQNPSNTRTLVFNMYRDWEDIIPFKAQSMSASDENVSFNSDLNFGQNSSGYWLNCGDVKNTRVSDVIVEKDIVIQDKAVSTSEFVANGSVYSKPIVTDGLFFQNITWRASEYFDPKVELQDIFVDTNNTIYFIQRSSEYRRLLRLVSNSTQTETKDIGTPINSVNLKISKINDSIIILGTNGFTAVYNTADVFSTATITHITNLSTTEDLLDILVWDNKVWIAGETKLWYADYATFNPSTSTFTEINLASFITNLSGTSIIEHVNKLQPVIGNYTVSSSLNTNLVNLLGNSSFEDGGVGNVPTGWTLEENATGSQFKISSDYSVNGIYSAKLVKSISSSYCSAVKKVANSESSYIASVSLRAGIATSDKAYLLIQDLDATNAIINTSTLEISPTTSWNRYTLAHVPVASTVSIKVEVRSEITANTTECIYIDAIQLETGSVVHEYVDTFEYLTIGFKKISSDVLNPPFAFIDKSDPYNIKYTKGKYGTIMSMNDVVSVGHNKLVFVSDKNVFNLTLLNNKGEYNRYTINPFIDNTNADYSNIKKFETIKKIGDKIYFGGIVDNRVIKIEAVQTGAQTITISDTSLSNGQSLLTLLGGYTVIEATDSRNQAIQFNRVQPCYEAPDKLTSAFGEYIPGATYSFTVTYNQNYSQIIQAVAPLENNGPWTIDQIMNQLLVVSFGVGLDIHWVATDASVSTLPYPEWYKVSSSVAVKDGLYCSNGKNQESLIRGNIHKIFVKSGSSDFYIVKDGQIFKSKTDSNLLKNGSIYEPYNWELHNSEYSLEEYNNVVNQEIVFSDDLNNHNWMNLNIGVGYSMLPGSLRVKTNESTEVGYSEDIDFFVDYANNRIIRSTNKNFAKNSSFALTSGNSITNWSFYSDSAASKCIQYTMNLDFTKYSVKMYKASGASKAVLYQKLTSQEMLGTPTFSSGSTYTFSVYLQSYIPQNSIIRISECVSGNADLFDDSQPYTGNTYTLNQKNTWGRFTVSHTIASSSSTTLRIEVYSNSSSQIFVSKPMIEKNTIVTPYVEGELISAIDPDSHVWIDYIKIKTLTSSDYTFDTSARTLNLLSSPNSNATYYLKYKYTKIFNPYKFGDAKPITEVIDYTDDDDYFLYELEGKIWAINQNLALMSLDTDNPLRISYKYYYPRIDQLKIRNQPDKYGNFLYLVQGIYHSNNPYRPVDVGLTKNRYVYHTNLENISDPTDTSQLNNVDNEILYEINVTTNDYTKNDIYDRRIYVNARKHNMFNISLYPDTIAYFPFIKDFNSTNGITPLNSLNKSKIVPIIKNYYIVQNSEVGAYHDSYQYNLRNNPDMIFPATTFSVFVDPINGSDTNSGDSSGNALLTISKALTLLTANRCNIIVTKPGSLSENVEIDKEFPVKIFASTHCFWKGGLQNNSELYIQGVWFQNTNIYCNEKLNTFFCTFENASFNCVRPETINIYNCEFKNCHNSIIHVKDVIFPSPFVHPYQKFALRDDGIAGNPESVATSNGESIAPGDSYYNAAESTQPEGNYNFSRCLIHDCTDTLIEYDPEPDWISKFYYSYCTIAHNVSLFTTDKYNITIEYENSILYKNSEIIESNEVTFDSNSDITFYNCFIDFSASAPDSEYNAGLGLFINRESCLGGYDDAEPGFIGMVLNKYDYHLKSIAKGSTIDSPCLGKGTSGDIGVYDESQEQQDKGLPKKLRTYVGFVGEGITYPIQLNSEKITITLEFKPTGSATQPGIVLDTRIAEDDEDYFVLVYNNNLDNDHSINQNPLNLMTNPYRFRVIVANKEKSYSIVSPINIQTDEEYQSWHKISFTINYEEIFNSKSTFTEKDTKQNIITLYHNDTVTIESFIKYDLNRYIDGELVAGNGNDGTNLWNFNNICQFITLGSDYDDLNKIIGYYTEFRVDNRFIDRKQLEMWNDKSLPFIDPMSYINQAPLARTFDSEILSDYWSLRSKSDKGAKGNRFVSGTSKKLTYEDGEMVWAVTEASNNLFNNGAFTNISTASVVADSVIDWADPIVIRSNIGLKTTASRLASDNTGISLNIRNPSDSGYSIISGYQDISKNGTTLTSSTATTLAAGTYNYRISINGGATTEKSVTLALNPTYGTIISALNTSTSGTASWSIVDGKIRCTSMNTTLSSSISVLAGTSSDLIAALGLTINTVVAATSIITLHSKSELISALEWGFAQIPQTLISFGFASNGRLRFFTKDWGLTTTVQITVTFTGTDNVGLGFSTLTKTGVRTVGTYTIAGITSPNVNPDNDVANGNHIWTNYDSDYAEFGSNCLYIQKNGSSANEDILKVNQQFNLGIGYYTFSSYIYSEDEVSTDSVKIIFKSTTVNFDSISRYYGNWWICTATFDIESASTASNIGVAFFKQGLFIIGGLQLENKYFRSAFAENYNTTLGKIIVPKNVINKSSGVIAFKFKPLFNFYETDTKYLLEALGVDDNNFVVSQGYRITYAYDDEKKRGIVTYSINGSTLEWSIEFVEKFWYQWHTCIINYDYNINRFVFWFDYYSNIDDSALVNSDLSNLYIGHGVDGASGDRTQAERPTNILVKDIIVTKYSITDTETLNWVNAYEFYNSSLIINTINEYKNEIEGYIGTTDNVVEVTNDLINQVEVLSNSVGAIESEYSAVTSNYTTLNVNVTNLTSRVTTVEGKVATLDDQLNDNADPNSIVNILEWMQNGAASGAWSQSVAGANLYSLRQDVNTFNTNLSTEASQRSAADLSIRNDLSSTASVSGASRIGINSSPATGVARFTATTVEAALREIAGANRTTESVMSVADAVSTLQSGTSATTTTLNLIKDGNTGTWTAALAQNSGWNIASLKSEISAHGTAIATNAQNIQNTNTVIGTEVDRLDGRIDEVYTTFASTAAGSGSSLIGFFNGIVFESTTVEAALKELAGIGRNSSMTVAGNYSVLQTHTGQILTLQTTVTGLTNTTDNINYEIGRIKDGNNGTTWTNSDWNLVEHEERLDIVDTTLSSYAISIDGHTMAIDNAVGRIGVFETNLTNEVNARQASDNLFKSTEADQGASLIGINDSSNKFTSTNVEGALTELANEVSAMAGSLSWKNAVATYSDLPTIGNNVGDARTVSSDNDGKQAQYVCVATTGTIAQQWQKIADIDWGNASAISYSNTTSGLTSTNVNDAIDEVFEKTKNPSKYEVAVTAAQWAPSDDNYVVSIDHNLETKNVVAMVVDIDTGMMVGVQEIERPTENSISILSSTPFNAMVTVFAVIDRFSEIINVWTPEGTGLYYHDIVHNFETLAVFVSVFDIDTHERVGVDNIEYLNENTIRIHVASNTARLNVFMTKKAQSTITKNIAAWDASGSSFISTIPDSFGFDAFYAFFNPATGQTIEIESVKVENGWMKLEKTNNDPIRLVVIQ